MNMTAILGHYLGEGDNSSEPDELVGRNESY